MHEAGLVSISYRELDFEDVLRIMVDAGLKYVEWGSNAQAPQNDIQKLQEIAQAQTKFGVQCCSYGTYFYLGITPIEELPDYIRAAKLLGTNVLRLWAGKKNPDTCTLQEKEMLFNQSKLAAEMAEAAGVTLCLECHRNTYTETAQGAFELMQFVDSKAFRMYWQPDPYATVADNIAYARLLQAYTVHLHAFHIKRSTSYPLSEGTEEWRLYLQEFTGNHLALLETLPDHRPETLQREADSLRRILNM